MWETIGLLCALAGLAALPYAMLYSYARNNDERKRPAETLPFEPFSIFSLKPIWRKCMCCHAYNYSTNTLCTSHAIPAPLVPLSYKTRYRVQRMSAVCIHTGDIEAYEQEAFERFALILMSTHEEIFWHPDEVAGLYHVDACVGSDIEEDGTHAVL